MYRVQYHDGVIPATLMTTVRPSVMPGKIQHHKAYVMHRLCIALALASLLLSPFSILGDPSLLCAQTDQINMSDRREVARGVNILVLGEYCRFTA
jgi:hypothetical protein